MICVIMDKVNFLIREQDCADVFYSLGPVYNACTPENHPIVFKTDADFKAGMSILAICALMFPRIRIYAYQLMSNHLHLVIAGEKKDIEDFFEYFRGRLDRYFDGNVDLCGYKLKLFLIEDLSYFRNAIVYVNRNGFVVNDNCTPFSYPWGSGSFFFQPMSISYARVCGKPAGIRMVREFMHTRHADGLKDVITVDGFVSPLEFCDIKTAERAFRDAKQYFYLISRNVETYANIARTIGESVFYNDNDLYLAAVKMAKDHFAAKDLHSLSASQKIDMARRLHFDFNAGDKQLQRLLKIDAEILKSLF